MTIAGVVIQTTPGAAAAVAARLASVAGLTIHAGDGESRLAAVWTAEEGESLETLAEQLVAGSADIVGVFPTFVGED